MKFGAMLFGLLLVAALPLSGQSVEVCRKQVQGRTSDDPVVPVIICQQLFPSPPYVQLPSDQVTPGGATIYGVIELDVAGGSPDYKITGARLYDRSLTAWDLFDATGSPFTNATKLAQDNRLPSNRVQYLVYEAIGKVIGNRLLLSKLRPLVLVEGRAIDERFLGPWEGKVTKRRTSDTWFPINDPDPSHFAPVRITLAKMTPWENMGEMDAKPILNDGKRFKVSGAFDNATTPVRLTTGECAPAMNSYGDANPFPDSVATDDYVLPFWRFPGMHTRSSVDFHIVFDWPKGFPVQGEAMVTNHNFRLKDYIATSTRPEDLVFEIHGNVINQIFFVLKPVRGGGGRCTALKE